MIIVDGSLFEGGGQIVRTALALSVVSRQAVRVENIRRGRPKPGLKVQHLKCIDVLEKLCNASVEGAKEGSQWVEFVPGTLRARAVEVDMQTAGSVTLLLQAVLLPMAAAGGLCSLVVRGGTNGRWAMPVEYVQHVLLPLIAPFYGDISVKVRSRGYYPKGGGVIELRTKPSGMPLSAFNLVTRGDLEVVAGLVHASDDLQSSRVCERAQSVIVDGLKHLGVPVRVDMEYAKSLSSGMGVSLWAVFSDERERVPDAIIGGDALADRAVSAEVVAAQAVQHLLRHVQGDAVVDPHVADNLIPFMALAGGTVRTSVVTPHAEANMYVCEKMLGTKFVVSGGLISAKVGEFKVVF